MTALEACKRLEASARWNRRRRLNSSYHLLHLRTRTLAADPPEQRRFPLLLVVFFLLPPAMGTLLGELTLPGFSLPTSALDAGMLQWCRSQADQFRSTQQQLQHLRVVQPLNRFSIHMCNKIRWSQSGLESRTTLVHGHHQVVHRVEIRIAVVHPDCVHRKTEPARSPPDDQRWLKISD